MKLRLSKPGYKTHAYVFSGVPFKHLKWEEVGLEDTPVRRDFILNILEKLCYTRDEEEWIYINSDELKRITGNNNNGERYRNYINLLKLGTDKGPIIEVNESYQIGETAPNKLGYTKSYRLTKKYLNRKRILYTYNKAQKSKKYNEYGQHIRLIESESELVQHSIKLIESLNFPTVEFLIKKMNKLVQNGLKDKRNRLYTLTKHDKNCHNLTDDLRNYERMLQIGLRIPKVSIEFRRMTDSLNLLPTWIREEIKITNEDNIKEEMIELDCKCLHANIVYKLLHQTGKLKYKEKENDWWQNNMQGDIYTKLLKYTKMNRIEIKKECLSFFNNKNHLCKHYKIYELFNTHAPTFISSMENVKRTNHKTMCKMLFDEEVTIMEKVIQQLEKLNIKVITIHDAIVCAKSNQHIVKHFMNEILKQQNIPSFVE